MIAHFAVMPASAMSLPHFSNSDFMYLPSASGVEGAASTPCATSRRLISGSFRIVTSSRLSRLVEDVVDLLAVDPHLVGERHRLRVVHEIVELVDQYEDVHGWDGTRDTGSRGVDDPRWRRLYSCGLSGAPGRPSG